MYPTTWRTSRSTSRWSSTQKVRATPNFIKDEMTGRVDIRKIFEKLQNIKNWSHMTKKRCFLLNYSKIFKYIFFFGTLTSFLPFLQLSKKKRQIYYIDSSGHLVFCKNFCSSNSITHFLRESFCNTYTSSVKKSKKSNPTNRRTSRIKFVEFQQ